MDIEQLKLVLDTLKSVGHEASSLAVLWMWLKFGSSALHILFWAIVIVGGMWIVARVAKYIAVDEESTRFLQEMRSLLNTGTYGALTHTERKRTQNLLRQLAEEYVAKQKQK